MDAAVAALIGTALGAAGGVAGTWLQQRYQSKRERQKMAVDLSVAEFEQTVKIALASKQPTALPPMSAYVLYHLAVLNIAEKRDLTADDVRTISDKHDAVARAFGGYPGAQQQDGHAEQ